MKVAVTDAAELTTHVPVPEHPPPDQPANTEPDNGEAESVTKVPMLKEAEQVPLAQLIPAEELVIVPPPVPA